MVRRIAALLVLLVIVALAVTLILRVYDHHVRNGTFEEEPTMVERALDADSREKVASAIL